jgi:hypothetical protein
MNDTAYDENGMKYSRMCLRMAVINYFNEEVMANMWFDDIMGWLNKDDLTRVNIEFDMLLSDE